MDVTLLAPSSVKIKSKNATFVVNPIGVKKQESDAALLFESIEGSKENIASSLGLIINGPGDYELKTVKLTGIGKSHVVAYQGKIDGVDVCITKSSLLTKAKDMFGEYNVLVLEEDEATDPATLAKLNATVAIVYGTKASENAKSLGKEPVTASKFSITKDKLPAELQVILLT